MKRTVVVIDGMGGGIGSELVARIKAKEPLVPGLDVEIIALGTNSTATERMLKAGADRGACGENAIAVSAKTGDYIIGPIGIVIADSIMGEITARIVDAVLHAPGHRILLPLANEHFHIAGADKMPIKAQLDEAVRLLSEHMAQAQANPGGHHHNPSFAVV
jgi:hypothetical protein